MSAPFSFFIQKCPRELQTGLKEIQKLHSSRFTSSPHSRKIVFSKSIDLETGLRVEKSGNTILVRYARPCDAFRALGRLLGENTPQELGRSFEETPKLKTLGVMLDVSRNGVLRPEIIKELLCRFALMGLNMTILYTEDTYEVPGEPFFGYLRGAYSRRELRALDRYASSLGIEMFPCIQTLGHLEQILKWPAYSELRDVEGVLLAEDERVYALLEKMIDAASSPFRSQRIHIGMDEAHGIGSGRYLKKSGYKRPFDILNGHLTKVNEICREKELQPMIWSDMYFRLGSKTGDYYDRNSRIPNEVARCIPRNVQLVYWDYYHAEEEFYTEWIRRHRAMGCEPIVAGGVWTWGSFWAALPYSFANTEACMQACKKNRVNEAFVTLWGDDGMECDLFSALPGIQFFAEHGYRDEIDTALLRSNFRGSCAGDFDALVTGSKLDSAPGFPAPVEGCNNVSKWLLWDDLLLGIAEPYHRKLNLKHHYQQLNHDLNRHAHSTLENRQLLFPAQLAHVLTLKLDIRRRLVAAYKRKDKGSVTKVQTELKKLHIEIRKLWKMHRQLWLRLYKPFGIEVLEHRYGGLLLRIESLSDRLSAWIQDDIASIPELESSLRQLHPGSCTPRLTHAQVFTASWIR